MIPLSLKTMPLNVTHTNASHKLIRTLNLKLRVCVDFSGVVLEGVDYFINVESAFEYQTIITVNFNSSKSVHNIFVCLCVFKI